MDGVEVHRYRYMNEANQTLAYGGGIPANLREDKKRWLFVGPFFGAGFLSALKLVKGSDLVHAHWSFAGLMASIACKFADKPYVVTFHGSDVMGASRPMRRVAHMVARSAASIIVHSRAMEEAVAEFADPDKIVTLPHGVDVGRFVKAHPEQGEPVRIVAVGRLAEEKGFDLLIEALGLLADRNDWRLDIAGDGPRKDDLVRQAEVLQIADRVNLLGELAHEKMAELLSESHLAVVPSRREGFGMACLEQAAAGLCVVATKSGGLEDIVQDEKTGLLVLTDDVQALSDGIAQLLDDSKLRKEMGIAGRRVVKEKFSLDVVTKQLEDVYRDVSHKP